jgi:hypothetical protein
MRKVLMITAITIVLAACGGTDYQGVGSTTSVSSVTEATTPSETAEPRQTAAERRQCEKYVRGLKRAEQRLAKLKREGPPAPVDGYDFTEDYNLELFETEREVEFYADALNSSPCVPDEDPYAGEGYDPSEDPNFDPNPEP